MNDSFFTETHAEYVVPDQPEMKKLYDAHQKLTNTMLSQQKNQYSTTLDTGTPQSLSPQTESASYDGPLFLSYVDSSSNKLVVGIDYRSPLPIEEHRAQLESFIGEDIPMEIGFGFFTRDSCDFPKGTCDPLIGGIQVVSPINPTDGTGTLGLPVTTNDGVAGFIMSGHVAGDGVTGQTIGQPGTSRIVGTITNNPLLDGRTSDAAFVAVNSGITLEQKIFVDGGLPLLVDSFVPSSSTPTFTKIRMVSPEQLNCDFNDQIEEIGLVVDVGLTVTDDEFGTLTNQVAGNYISCPGDSGAPVFSRDTPDVRFYGIHVGRACFGINPLEFTDLQSCNAAGGALIPIYSPWEGIQQELNLSEQNNLPIANGQNVITNENTPVTITLTGSDKDFNPLQFFIVGFPTHGELSHPTSLTPVPNPTSTSVQIIYEPNSDFSGPDDFQFKVTDGIDESSTVTVNITVEPVATVGLPIANAGPNLVNPGVLEGTEVTLDGSLSRTQPSGGVILSFTWTQLPTAGVSNVIFVSGQDTATPTIRLPFVDTDSFLLMELEVCDSSGCSDPDDQVLIKILNSGVSQEFITNPSPTSKDKFGSSVSIFGTNSDLLIGAPRKHITTGISSLAFTYQSQSSTVVPDKSSIDSSYNFKLFFDDETNTAYLYDRSLGVDDPILTLTNDTNSIYFYEGADDDDPPILIKNIQETNTSLSLYDEYDLDNPLLTIKYNENTEESHQYPTQTNNTGTLMVNNNPVPQENLALFVNEVTGNSYLFDTATGVMLLIEISDAGGAFIINSAGTTLLTIDNPTPESRENFGDSVTEFGNKFVVGVPRDKTLGGSGVGAVYLFDGTQTGFTNTPILTIHNPNPNPFGGDRFGHDVEIMGGKIIISADQDEHLSPGTSSGSVYVFDGTITGTAGPPLLELGNPDPDVADLFGSSVAALGGNKIVVGTPNADEVGSDTGSVYVFDGTASGITTTPILTINNPSPAFGDRFGFAVSVIGNFVLVGAPSDDTVGTDAGTIYVFDGTVTGTIDTPILTINNPNPTSGDEFGESVDAIGDIIFAGAPGHTVAGQTSAGSVYLFDGRLTGTISEALLVIDNDDPVLNDDYGTAVSTRGDKYLIGIPGKDSVGRDTGAAFNVGPTIVLPTEPEQTTNLSASALSEFSIFLSWDEPANGGYLITGYKIERESPIGGGFSILVEDTGSTFTTYTDSGLTPDTEHNYRVSAINLLGTGQASTPASATTLPKINTPPVITLLGNNPETVELNFDTYIDAGATAFDAEDGDITGNIITVNPVDESTLGTYIITYDVTDSSGSPAIQITRTVNVVDTTPPTLTVPADATFDATGILTPLDKTDFGTATAIDAGDPSPVISNNAPTEFPLGDTIITWTATDSSGNSQSGDQTVTLIDTTPPSFTDLISDIVEEATGPDGNNVNYVIPGASDVIDPAPTVICTPAPDSLFPLGDTTVTCTATDASGNSFSETFMISVVDTTAPSITAPANQSFEATAVLSPLTSADYGLATGSDIFTPVTITSDAPATFPLGDTTITWTATDDNGLANTATQTVTIINASPVGVPDVYFVDEDNVLIVSDYAGGVLGNDIDPNDPIISSADLVTEPTDGILLLNTDGTFEYDPDENFFGIDTFTYIPNDGFLVGSETTVTINIQPVNDVPIAGDRTISTDLNNEVEILLTGSDIDGDFLSLNLFTLPSDGTITEIIEVSSNSISIKYKPDVGFIGIDSFDYAFNDAVSQSNTATVTVLIAQVVPPGEDTLQTEKSDIIIDLEEIKTDNLDSRIVKKVDQAIKHIEKSVSDELWQANGIHLDDKFGKKVFSQEAKAAKKLVQILKKVDESSYDEYVDETDDEGDDDDDDNTVHFLPMIQDFKDSIQSIIDRIVSLDERFTDVSVIEANAALSILEADPNTSDKLLKKVQKQADRMNEELQKAQEKLDEGDFDKAILHYKKAWKHAEKTIKIVS